MLKPIFFLIFVYASVALAQPGTGRSNSSAGLLSFPALSGSQQADTSGKLKFDRRIQVAVEGGSNPSVMYLYFNTHTGELGMRTGRPGTLGDGSIDINQRNFTLSAWTPTRPFSSGKVVFRSFSNDLKNGEIRHRMITGGTSVAPLSLPRTGTTLTRGTGSQSYTSRGLTATAYSAGGPTFYLYGASSPRTLVVQKWIAYAGIGYLKTNRGIFLALEMDGGEQGYFKAMNILDLNDELDVAQFNNVEAESLGKAQDEFDTKLAKLRNETFSAPCETEKRNVNQARQASLLRQQQALRRARSGNVFEGNTAIAGYADLADHLGVIETADKDLELSKCKLDRQIAAASSSNDPGTVRRLTEKKLCYQQSQIELNRARLELEAVDQRYPNNPARAGAEKNQIIFRVSRDNCR